MNRYGARVSPYKTPAIISKKSVSGDWTCAVVFVKRILTADTFGGWQENKKQNNFVFTWQSIKLQAHILSMLITCLYILQMFNSNNSEVRYWGENNCMYLSEVETYFILNIPNITSVGMYLFANECISHILGYKADGKFICPNIFILLNWLCIIYDN